MISLRTRAKTYAHVPGFIRTIQGPRALLFRNNFGMTSIFSSSAQAKMEREYGILRDVDKTLADGMFQDAKLYSGMATSIKE